MQGSCRYGPAGAAEFFDHRPEVAEYWVNRYGIASETDSRSA